ncbi:hypothetical protein Tco_0095690, partial [Tanacetum coccineum]
LERGFFESIDSDLFSGPQWEDLFWVNEPVYRELVREFFAIFSYGDSTCINNPRAARIQFRLGGGQRSFSLVEFRWRVGLYSKTEGDEIGTELALRNAMMVRDEHRLIEFWPTIGDGEFTTESMVARMIRDPRVRLAHHCIATTILARRDSTQRITLIDLFFMSSIYSERVLYNIPFWSMMGALIVKPPAQVFGKKSLVAMEIFIELVTGQCNWIATRLAHLQKQEQIHDEEEEAEDDAGGFA